MFDLFVGLILVVVGLLVGCLLVCCTDWWGVWGTLWTLVSTFLGLIGWVWVFDWLVCDFDVCEFGCLELIVWICVSIAVVCRILVSLEFG